MTETRIIVEPAILTYKGGDVRLAWARIVDTSIRHWGWTSLFLMIAIGGLIGGYFISDAAGVLLGIAVEGTNLLVARKMVRRSLRVERQSH